MLLARSVPGGRVLHYLEEDGGEALCGVRATRWVERTFVRKVHAECARRGPAFFPLNRPMTQEEIDRELD